MGELFKELYNIPQANDYLETNIYSKDKFNKPVQQSEIIKIISPIQNSLDKINEMFEDSFDSTSVSSILPLLLNSLSDKNISSI